MLRVMVKDLGHDFGEYPCDESCSDNQCSERNNVIHWIPLSNYFPLSLTQLLRDSELNLSEESWEVVNKKLAEGLGEATSTP